jgi:hypothetical protein
MLRFTIRDVLWLMVVVALLLVLWNEWRVNERLRLVLKSRENPASLNRP